MLRSKNAVSTLYVSSYCVFFALCLSVVIITLVSSLLYLSYHPKVSIPELQAQFTAFYADRVNPKPREKFAFLITLFLTPFICFISMKWVQKAKVMRVSQITNLCIALVLGALGYFLSRSEYVELMTYFTQLQFSILCTLIVTAGYYIFMLSNDTRYKPFFSKKIDLLIFVLVTCAILLPSWAYRISTLYSVLDNNSIWVDDFEAVFYTVTQVIGGKTLLVDLAPQYGLYAEFLAPIFKLVGQSVLKLTIMMEILQISALSVIFISLILILRSRILIFLCMITLCMVMSTWYYQFDHGLNPYYQYFPIRLLFPALSVLCMIGFLKSQLINPKKVVLFSAFSALAVLWNIDSGIPILGAFLVYLFSFVLLPAGYLNRKSAIKYLLLSITTVVILFAIFIGYLAVKSNSAVHISWLTTYQKIFYQTGFMMLPLPFSFNAWQVILSIYLLGMLLALQQWMHGRRLFIWDLTFYLGVMGIGLFMYFEGRSHPYNLVNVSWPAILIAFITTDQFMRLIQKKALPKVFMIYCYFITLFGILVAANYVLAIPYLSRMGMQNWHTILRKPDSAVTRNIDFIKQHITNENALAILAPNQAVYLIELNKPSALVGPGNAATLLQKDFNQMADQISEDKITQLFLQLDENNHTPEKYVKPLQHYVIKDISQDHLADIVLNP